MRDERPIYQRCPAASAQRCRPRLTKSCESGARQLLAQAVEMEAEAFLLAMKGLKLPDGRDRLVRHGHGPER